MDGVAGSPWWCSVSSRCLCLALFWVVSVTSLPVTSVTSPGMNLKSVTSPVLSSKNRLDTWLSDEIFYDLELTSEQPQADDGGHVGNTVCPPVSTSLPVGSCESKICRSDKNCSKICRSDKNCSKICRSDKNCSRVCRSDCYSKMLTCCNTGCVYTCLPDDKPAPYFDWIKVPIRRLDNGQSWLVPGPNNIVNIELCSTTPSEDDSDPLVCPHGHLCSIDDEGNPEQGIPNKGHCVLVEDPSAQSVQLTADQQSQILQTNHQGPLEDTVLHHACNVGDGQLLISGHQLVINGHNCKCHETKLTCTT
ncbi:uncharacterized protein LOC131929361 [Physella acuta]|uniref:uncharacterized protein LOC131929361 n=1 Tax=Physella acuta TaxID=109671 RepID=UPI0027DBC5A4|nr:uncharacterized protein LOC131929361 [Physella acuta]